MSLFVGACLLALAGCGEAPITIESVSAEDAATTGVEMDRETQARMGVKTSPAALAQAPRIADGFARVMDVGPLAAIESEVSAAFAAASASEEEYRRLEALAAQDQAASARSVEAARAQAAADIARAGLARRRIGLEWGAGLEKMPDAQRSQLLTDIGTGRAALVRLDAPGASADVSGAAILADSGGAEIKVVLIGQAAAADPRLQTTGLLALVQGPAASSLAAGQLLPARLQLGAEENGVVLVETALVRSGGDVIVYVKTGDETFERRDVGRGRTTPGGWFVADSVKAGDLVVTEGAASVAAAEAGPVEAE
jgi:hypothetical protein